MKEYEFEQIQGKLKEYQFHSMNYIGFEDVENFTCIRNDSDLILICGRDEEAGMQQVQWAANDVTELVKGLQEVKEQNKSETIRVSFVPEEWVKPISEAGYEMFCIWHDYFIHDLNACCKDGNDDYECLTEKDCKSASEVTCLCKGQSRGFTGQTQQWIKEWINNTENSAVNTEAKYAATLVHRDETGHIDGIVCTAVYDFASPRGPIVWIREIAVEPKAQGKGIGRKLLMQAFQYGKEHGATRAFLAADECNHGAIHLYQSVGFVPSEEDGEINLVSK